MLRNPLSSTFASVWHWILTYRTPLNGLELDTWRETGRGYHLVSTDLNKLRSVIKVYNVVQYAYANEYMEMTTDPKYQCDNNTLKVKLHFPLPLRVKQEARIRHFIAKEERSNDNIM